MTKSIKRDIEKIYFNKEQIDEHKKLMANEYLAIRQLESKISQHKKQIENYQNVLLDNCNHNRVPDRSCAYDHTTYYCDICGQDLWNFH